MFIDCQPRNNIVIRYLTVDHIFQIYHLSLKGFMPLVVEPQTNILKFMCKCFGAPFMYEVHNEIAMNFLYDPLESTTTFIFHMPSHQRCLALCVVHLFLIEV